MPSTRLRHLVHSTPFCKMMQSTRRALSISRLHSTRRFASTRPTLAPLPTGPEAVPTHAAPAPWQRGAQALGFVLAGVAGVYSVLFYEFEQENHCFVPIRKQFSDLKQQFMTLPEDARQTASKAEKLDKPSSTTRLV